VIGSGFSTLSPEGPDVPPCATSPVVVAVFDGACGSTVGASCGRGSPDDTDVTGVGVSGIWDPDGFSRTLTTDPPGSLVPIKSRREKNIGELCSDDHGSEEPDAVSKAHPRPSASPETKAHKPPEDLGHVSKPMPEPPDIDKSDTGTLTNTEEPEKSTDRNSEGNTRNTETQSTEGPAGRTIHSAGHGEPHNTATPTPHSSQDRSHGPSENNPAGELRGKLDTHQQVQDWEDKETSGAATVLGHIHNKYGGRNNFDLFLGNLLHGTAAAGHFGPGPTPDLEHINPIDTGAVGGPHGHDLTGAVLTATTPVLFLLSAVAVALLGYSLCNVSAHKTAHNHTTRTHNVQAHETTHKHAKI
ncbi:hypothetical protein AK88_04186, partial [Plasmodium fragile]